jgi:hypothetical protein
MIAVTMIPAFLARVAPQFPRGLSRLHHALATAHAVLGGVTELGGLHTLLAAGTPILPDQFRITLA